MSGIQSPQILTDLYRDLRDRRLLPLVLVLVVGMAVVPIALSSSGETPVPPAAPPPAPASAKSNVPAEEVVVTDPGVRDYQRRLEGDAPKDPFVQEFTTPLIPAAGSAPSAGSSADSLGGSTTTGTGATPPTTPAAPTGGSDTTQSVQSETKFFYYRIKVRTGQVGQEMQVRENVQALTSLPSKAVPALAFLGVTTKSSFQPKSAVFLVSSGVSSLDGEGACTFAGTTCQLLELKPGEYEDLVWSDGLVYRVSLVNFNLVVRDKPPSVTGGGDSSSGRG